MLRSTLLRSPAGARPASAVSAVRRLAEVVGPKDPAIKQAAEEAARVTGAGETGLAVEQPAWAQASDVGGGTSGDAGQVAQDNRSPYCGVAPSAGPTAEERLQAEAAAGERMKPRGEPGGGQQDEGSANKGGDWTGIGNEQAGTT